MSRGMRGLRLWRPVSTYGIDWSLSNQFSSDFDWVASIESNQSRLGETDRRHVGQLGVNRVSATDQSPSNRRRNRYFHADFSYTEYMVSFFDIQNIPIDLSGVQSCLGRCNKCVVVIQHRKPKSA